MEKKLNLQTILETNEKKEFNYEEFEKLIQNIVKFIKFVYNYIVM